MSPADLREKQTPRGAWSSRLHVVGRYRQNLVGVYGDCPRGSSVAGETPGTADEAQYDRILLHPQISQIGRFHATGRSEWICGICV